MSILKTEAIVLRTRPFRSSSLIITFFTQEYGKIQGIAKGIHREGERRGAEFELFTHLEILFYEKKRSDLQLVSETSIIDSYPHMRSSLESLLDASFFCELTEELTETRDPHPQIFELLQICFRYLSVLPAVKLRNLFEMKLLNEIGWQPHLDHCLKCAVPLPESAFFSVREGGLLCSAHKGDDLGSKKIGTESLKLLRFLSSQAIEACLRETFTLQAEIEVQNMLYQFLLYRLGKPLKSLKVRAQLLRNA
ncbi:MAG TPA: DNA repair protein RecO [Candidatus Omnitrophota bacterium]|nr:DNA repair protein RecO [Candidatus Omnitrophota bacterium]